MRASWPLSFFLTLVLALILAAPGAAHAQGRTDVVTLANGDRITGEITKLDRGRLEFKTDDEGTILFEWDKIVAVEAARQFEVGTTDGQRYLGTLGRSDPRSVIVTTAGGAITLTTEMVTFITPIGRSFWTKLDGSVDAGFSYTRSSKIAQLNLNSATVYRRPAFEARITGAATLTQNEEDGERNDRAVLQGAYIRYRGVWFVSAGGGLESNESLGIKLRSQVAGAGGQRLVNTNRAQLSLGAGLAVNQERPLDAETTQNVEAMFLFNTSFFSYDNPRTNIDVGLQYYPSLSDIGRHRLQLDSALKREVWKDVFLSVNFFDTYDSRPPTANAESNDVGIVFSFGWSY